MDARSDQQGVRKHHTLRTSTEGGHTKREASILQAQNTSGDVQYDRTPSVGFCARQVLLTVQKGKAERGAGRRGPGTPFCDSHEFDSMRGTDGARLLLRRPPADDHDQAAWANIYRTSTATKDLGEDDCVVCQRSALTVSGARSSALPMR